MAQWKTFSEDRQQKLQNKGQPEIKKLLQKDKRAKTSSTMILIIYKMRNAFSDRACTRQ